MATVYQKRGKLQIDYSDASGARKTMYLPRATTKGEANRLARDLEHKVARQQQGLEPLPNTQRLTLAEMCQWWIDEHCQPASQSRERSRFKVQIQAHAIGGMEVSKIDAATFEAHFKALKNVNIKDASGLKASTINSLRARLNTVYRVASKMRKWRGENPLPDTKRRPEDDIVYRILEPAQADATLQCLAPIWRGLFATAFFLGMRKGELFGMQKKDVNLADATLTIQRSHGRDRTKSGRIRVVPIPAPLLPFISAALESSGPYLFPNERGERRNETTKVEQVLRRSLARASIVTGYRHICRRCAARKRPHEEIHADAELRRCPRVREDKSGQLCGAKLWE